MSLADRQRQALVDGAAHLYAHRGLMAYREVRPFRVRTRAQTDELFAHRQAVPDLDCSAAIITLYHWAHASDPSGEHFSGSGNTETMLAHLPHYTDPHKAHKGAIAIFNADRSLGVQHACMVIGPAADPMLFSHGGPGVDEMRLSAMQTGFSGHTVFLDVSGLGS